MATFVTLTICRHDVGSAGLIRTLLNLSASFYFLNAVAGVTEATFEVRTHSLHSISTG